MNKILFTNTVDVPDLNSAIKREISLEITDSTRVLDLFTNFRFFLYNTGMRKDIVDSIFNKLTFQFPEYNGNEDEEHQFEYDDPYSEKRDDEESMEEFKKQLNNSPDFLHEIFNLYLDSLEDYE